jgi:uncharacterized Fe-S cluster protein YjdI
MKILKSFFLAVLILLLLGSPVFAKTFAQRAETSVVSCSQSQGTVSLTVKKGNTTLFNIPNVPWIEGETVRLAMLNAEKSVDPSFKFKEKFSCPFGNLVTQIGNVIPNKKEFWALYVNDKFSDRGIDTAVLQKDDKIQWQIQSID